MKQNRQVHMTPDQLIMKKNMESVLMGIREKHQAISGYEFEESTSDGTGFFKFDTLADGSVHINVVANKFMFKGNLASAVPKWLMSQVLHAFIKMINQGLKTWNDEKKAATQESIANNPAARKLMDLAAGLTPSTKDQPVSDEQAESQLSPEAVAS